MDMALAGVAEKLAYEFAHLHSTAVVRVLTDCVDECPRGGPHFVEQAARARLSRLPAPQVRLQRVSERSSLDVSLHDHDLAEEVDMMVRLIIAANESDRTLAREDIDEILGVSGNRHRFSGHADDPSKGSETDPLSGHLICGDDRCRRGGQDACTAPAGVPAQGGRTGSRREHEYDGGRHW